MRSMSFNEYRQEKGVNISSLKEMLKSPAHYRERILNPQPPTPALELGTTFHSWVLEGVEPVCAPVVDRRTKAGKEAWAEFVAANEGKTVLSSDDYVQLHRMFQSVLDSQAAASLLAPGGKVEQSIFWQDSSTGLGCKGRPDYVGDGYVVDLKTAVDASPQGFAKAIFNFSHHMQAAFYLDGLSATGGKYSHFYFVAVEKTPPFNVGIYELDAQAIQQGRRAYKNALHKVLACLEDDNWPGYGDEITTLSLPRWAQENENELF